MNKIRHTGLVTNNLKKSLFFWNKVLKFKIYKRAIESGDLIDRVMEYKKVKVETVKLSDSSGMLLEILHFKNSPKRKKNFIKPYTNGFTHLSITLLPQDDFATSFIFFIRCLNSLKSIG